MKIYELLKADKELGSMMASLLAKATSQMQRKSDIAKGLISPNGIPKLHRNMKFPTQLLCPSGLTKHSTKMMKASGTRSSNICRICLCSIQ